MKSSHLKHPPHALLLALLLALAGCGKSPEQHLAEGEAFFQKADYKSAAIALKSTLQERPADLQARLLLAKTQYRLGAYADAQKELEKAKQLGAPDDQTLGLLAMVLLHQGKTQDVLKMNIPAESLSSPSLALMHTARATALYQTNLPEAAQKELALAQRAYESLPELLLLQARVAFSDNRVQEAERLIDTALAANPKLKEALYMKAANYLSQGKPDQAEAVYRQILDIDPGAYEAVLAIADVQYKKGDMQAAEQSIQTAEKIAPNALQVRYTRGLFELRRGKMEAASSALLDILRVAPDHRPTALAYAIASTSLGKSEQGLKYAEKILASEPENLLAAQLVAANQIKIGNAQSAIKTLTAFLPKYPQDAKLLTLMGEAYMHLKDYNQAMRYFDKAEDLDPGSALIKSRQAAGHLSKGASTQAMADLEKAVTLSDRPDREGITLVFLQLRNSEFDKALQTIHSLESRLPANPMTHTLRAGALLGKKDITGARDALERALRLQPSFYPAAINLARLDMQAGKPDMARKRIESVLEKDKNNTKAMLALAQLALVQKQDARFLEWMDKAIQNEPAAFPAYQQLINYYLDHNQDSKALAVAKRAVDTNPDNLGALELMAATQNVLGNTAAALQGYTRMTQVAPSSAVAHFLLGRALLDSAQASTARAPLRKALELKPDMIQAQELLIRLELKEKNPQAALAIAHQIQARHPEISLGFEYEGDILATTKQYSQAIRSYAQALAKGGEIRVFHKQNRAVTLTGDIKTAERQLQEWIRNHPNDVSARIYAAQWFTGQDRSREAISQYEAALRLQPDNAGVLNNLAVQYQKVHDTKALVTAEQALKRSPDSALVLDTLGWILLEQGQLPRALKLLSDATAKSPGHATIRYHYAVALLRNGQQQQAKLELAKALELDQRFPEREEARRLLRDL